MILSVPMLENPHSRFTMLNHYPGQVSVEHRTTLTRTPEVHGQEQTSSETFKKEISCVSACVPVYLCVCANISVYVHMHVYEYVNVCAPVCMCIDLCLYVLNICLCVCMSTCMGVCADMQYMYLHM